MMNRRSLNFKYYLIFITTLVPLIIFGFYKNGIYLYNKEYINFISMFKPLIIVLMGILGGVLAKIIRDYKKRDKFNIDNYLSVILDCLLLTMILPLKSSPFIIFIVTLGFNLFFYNVRFNKIAIMYIILMGINYLLGLNIFGNVYEINTVLNYNGLDLFVGYGVGGIFSTSILLSLIALIVLSFNKIYKKDLVYSSLITFLILGIIPNMLSGEYNQIFKLIFGYNIIFILIFIAPNINSTSYTMKGQILSGIILGVLTYFIQILTPYNAVIISILLINVMKNVFDRIFVLK